MDDQTVITVNLAREFDVETPDADSRTSRNLKPGRKRIAAGRIRSCRQCIKKRSRPLGGLF